MSKVSDKEVHISQMTGKLEGFRAISTNTVTNKFCQKMYSAKKETICSHCYSHQMLNTYRKNMQAALQRNSDLLSAALLSDDQVPQFKIGEAVRFSAHGELINLTHLQNLVKIAEMNPWAHFTLWTKRKDLVLKVTAPSNMMFIYSNPELDKIMWTPPAGFHKTFNNVDESKFTEYQNCTGSKCKDCMVCYSFDNNTNVIVEAIK